MRVALTRALARARRPEILAVLAGALVVLIGWVAFGGSPRDQRSMPGTSRTGRTTRDAPNLPPALRTVPTLLSRAGAVQAATRYLAELSAAGVSGSGRARRVVEAATTGSLQAKLLKALPGVAGAIQARLTGSRSADVFAGWPLGFRVERFAASQAMVALWHLDVGASSALELMTAQYTTTTYSLRWINGMWRVYAVSSVPGPTPPSASAPAVEVDQFAREINGLSRYVYVP